MHHPMFLRFRAEAREQQAEGEASNRAKKKTPHEPRGMHAGLDSSAHICLYVYMRMYMYKTYRYVIHIYMYIMYT